MSLLFRIWEENKHVFWAVAYSVLHNREHTEDVLQDAFARLLRRNHPFRDRPEAFNYARTTVLNTAIDLYRRLDRQRRFCRHTDRVDAFPSRDGYNPLGLLLQEQEAGRRSRLMAEIAEAIKSLPPREREALGLFFGRDSSTSMKQTCAERGLAYSTLRGRLLRCIDRIREHLRTQGVAGFSSEEDEP